MTVPRPLDHPKAKAGIKRWIVTVLAAVFALGSLLHIDPSRAASLRADVVSVVSDRNDGMLGSHIPVNTLPGQPHDSQLADCSISGVCGLCSVTFVGTAVAPRVVQAMAPDVAAVVISRTISPPLRPPTLLG